VIAQGLLSSLAGYGEAKKNAITVGNNWKGTVSLGPAANFDRLSEL
jgi:hypothetical protein